MDQFINMMKTGAVVVVSLERDRSGKMVPVAKLKINGREIPDFNPNAFTELKANLRLKEQKVGKMSIYRM